MIKYRDKNSGRNAYLLYPGEYFATKEDCFIISVTGVCMLVCLYETKLKFGGMCFVIVPGTFGTENIITSVLAGYGITQIELLLAEIVKAGGDRKNLTAKIFGAAYSNNGRSADELSESQIRFIKEYFTSERIPVLSSDLGGSHRRKIYFSPATGRVYKKILRNNNESSEFLKMEKEFIDDVFMNTGSGNFTLFERDTVNDF
ncbi:MAG: hypothetical protein JW982_00890 [Spirochaetes bacterium]|nr:hypothetical protein [Spirochaetota bacterium]